MRVVATLAFVLAATAVTPSGQAPLPEPSAFFAEVRERLASNSELRAGYAYRERRTELRLNPFGRMGTGPVQVYDVFPGPDRETTYRRLVERDGQTVSQSEIAQQDRKHLATLEAHRRDRARETDAERARRLGQQKEELRKAGEERDHLLDLMRFSITRRDTWEGHPAIVVRFERRPGAEPRSREGRLVTAKLCEQSETRSVALSQRPSVTPSTP
jgi:hypothetical protein